MGLRWKIALSLALVAMIATFTVGVIGYRTTSARLVDEVDRSITQATGQMIGRAVDGRITMPTRSLLEVYSVRVLDADGASVASRNGRQRHFTMRSKACVACSTGARSTRTR